MVIFSATDSSKNFIGSNLLGYSTCPNCGDSWWWKESKSITFDSNINAIIFEEGVMICKECVLNPKTLDENRICKNLLKWSWDEEKVQKVKEAIIQYKDSSLQEQNKMLF
ncbi:MAG: hypothetical protein Q7S33_02350 [Nanoarchaeota archaeon]|nr:hypothetical protein [Nanoarchaeota archaeon]